MPLEGPVRRQRAYFVADNDLIHFAIQEFSVVWSPLEPGVPLQHCIDHVQPRLVTGSIDALVAGRMAHGQPIYVDDFNLLVGRGDSQRVK